MKRERERERERSFALPSGCGICEIMGVEGTGSGDDRRADLGGVCPTKSSRIQTDCQ
jgi:hypothetical protein